VSRSGVTLNSSSLLARSATDIPDVVALWLGAAGAALPSPLWHSARSFSESGSADGLHGLQVTHARVEVIRAERPEKSWSGPLPALPWPPDGSPFYEGPGEVLVSIGLVAPEDDAEYPLLVQFGAQSRWTPGRLEVFASMGSGGPRSRAIGERWLVDCLHAFARVEPCTFAAISPAPLGTGLEYGQRAPLGAVLAAESNRPQHPRITGPHPSSRRSSRSERPPSDPYGSGWPRHTPCGP